MDVDTLQRYFEAGLYKELTPADRKLMDVPALRQYKDVFQFMLDHNCKVEKESLRTRQLMKEKDIV